MQACHGRGLEQKKSSSGHAFSSGVAFFLLARLKKDRHSPFICPPSFVEVRWDEWLLVYLHFFTSVLATIANTNPTTPHFLPVHPKIWKHRAAAVGDLQLGISLCLCASQSPVQRPVVRLASKSWPSSMIPARVANPSPPSHNSYCI
ncbi:hypothetical protein EJ03DRAFT_328814 [Teratosphaeria nubilosa]|uniref:Uncharacterized protein n=1 Tax=Teratosphaeria nubilosa TaxID=161662 RepID=A0A6G1L4E4_9PEZI|nr:hypothetical protein EJ03DRAFT_328814 [Teratosphaeria nubilosa]